MDNDKIIDAIFKELKKRPKSELIKFCETYFGPSDLERYREIIKKLIYEELIIDNGRFLFSITAKGKEVINIGGYQEYVKAQSQKTIDGRNREDLEKEKLHYETKLARWQTKIFWPIFVFTLIGSICGIIALIWQIMSGE